MSQLDLRSIAKAMFRQMLAEPDSNGCRVFLGKRDSDGYGVVPNLIKKVFGQYSAHRTAYVLAHGSIPIGLLIMHKCDNPPCCAEAHLSVGTYVDNFRDRIAKGRPGAPGRPRVAVVRQRILVSLLRAGLSTRAVARQMQLAPSTVWTYLNRHHARTPSR